METRKKRTKVVMSVLALAALLLFSLFAIAGNLEPNAPPGPTMHTLDEIYNVISPPAQPMAYDGFLQIEGIEGEAQDKDHKGWIDILDYQHSVQKPGTLSAVEMGDFYVVKALDKASPKLALYCCEGRAIPSVVLELRRATEDKQTFMKYTFTDVTITSVSVLKKSNGGSAQSTALPMEEISFRFGQIQWEYTPADRSPTVTASWKL